jgi:hypothetical protein
MNCRGSFLIVEFVLPKILVSLIIFLVISCLPRWIDARPDVSRTNSLGLYFA